MKNLWFGRIENKRLKQTECHQWPYHSNQTLEHCPSPAMAAVKPELQSQSSSSTMAGWPTKHHLTSQNSFPALGQPPVTASFTSWGCTGTPTALWDLQWHCRGSWGRSLQGQWPWRRRKKVAPKGMCSCLSQTWFLPTLRNYPYVLKAHHNMGNFSAEIGPKRPLCYFFTCLHSPKHNWDMEIWSGQSTCSPLSLLLVARTCPCKDTGKDSSG